jgi:hypothetical protein
MSLTKIAAVAALFAFGVTAADAASYVTTVGYGVSNPNGDKAVIEWSTGVATGDVVAGDLTDLKFSLFAGASLLYADHAIISGELQSIGGVARTISTFYFDFSLTSFASNPSAALRYFSNDEDSVQSNAKGVTYGLAGHGLALIANDDYMQISKYSDGSRQASSSVLGDVTLESTVVTSEVPLPAGVLLLPAALAGLGLVRRRRAA